MENTAREKAEKPRGKASRIFFAASVIYSLISFLFYIGLDAYKIYRDGWTAANIVVTVFLALQTVKLTTIQKILHWKQPTLHLHRTDVPQEA